MTEPRMPCGHPDSHWKDEKPRTYGLGEYRYYIMCGTCGAKFSWMTTPRGLMTGEVWEEKYTPPPKKEG